MDSFLLKYTNYYSIFNQIIILLLHSFLYIILIIILSIIFSINLYGEINSFITSNFERGFYSIIQLTLKYKFNY